MKLIGYKQLLNYCFIIPLDGCKSSFYCIGKFMMMITFPVKLVINKVVDNLLILLVSNFHGNRLNGLGVIAVRSLLSEFAWLLDRSG